MRAKLLRLLASVVVLGLVAGLGWLTRERWLALFQKPTQAAEKKPDAHDPAGQVPHVVLSEQARKNLGLRVDRLTPVDHWKTITIPGQVVELAGHSDRILNAPLAGIISQVHCLPWQTIRPGEKLFTLQIISEFVLSSQTSLYKASEELKATRQLLADGRRSGTLPATRLLELELQEKRLEAAVRTHRSELAARGFRPEALNQILAGEIITTLDVAAPELNSINPAGPPLLYEVQALKVNSGEQVQAGQPLCTLTDHRHLYIEGHAFKDEVRLIEDILRERRMVEVELLDGRPSSPLLVPLLLTPGRPAALLIPGAVRLRVSFLSNVVDPKEQTFPFYLDLPNRPHDYTEAGRGYRIWQYRPGQRVRLHVPYEKLSQVLRLPREAVIREGAEAFAFKQNGDAFERYPVQIRYEDERYVVIEADAEFRPGVRVALNAAAALNRALKTQAGGGEHEHHHHH